MSKILLASHPFDGHYGPFTSLAVHLKRRGHDVRWYTGGSYAKRIAALGIPHYPFVRAKEITAFNLTEHFPDYDTDPSGPKVLRRAIREMFFAPIEPQYRDVSEIHASFPFDALICDAPLYMGRLVAEKLEPRVYVLAAAPTPAPTSATAPAPLFGFKPARTLLGRIRDRIANRLHGWTASPGLALLHDLRRREGLPRYEGSAFDLHVEKSRAIFQIGVPGLEFPRTDWPANFRFIGALLPERRAGNLPTALKEKLERYPTLVVVSQGTTDNRDANKLFVPALEAFAGGAHLVAITTGGRHTEDLRRRFPQDNVVVEDWIDFHELLLRTDLLVTNGGFGSVLLALSYGVPLLCAGKLEGKADINARLDYRGVAVDLRTERPTPAQIKKGAARILGDPRYAGRVAEVRAELTSYRPLDIIDAALAEDGILAPSAAALEA
jgi:UDP:flavonoid glycosyltransferase YjiC (YdhE family)